MIRKSFLRYSLLLGLGVGLLTLQVWAQRAPRGARPGGRPGAAQGTNSPTHRLDRMVDFLAANVGLTTNQAVQVRQVVAKASATAKPLQTRLQTARKAIREAVTGGKAADVRALEQQVGAVHARLAALQVEAYGDIVKLLEGEQLEDAAGYYDLLGVVVGTGASLPLEMRLAPNRASRGLRNFDRVNDKLYRSAQLDELAIDCLQRFGVRSVINLCTSNEVWVAEEAQARAAGMSYTNVPLHATQRPKDEQIELVLGLVESLPAPVLVHCRAGADRTGTVVASYRVRKDGWTSEAALQEAAQHGMSPLEVGMKAFVADLGKALEKK